MSVRIASKKVQHHAVSVMNVMVIPMTDDDTLSTWEVANVAYSSVYSARDDPEPQEVEGKIDGHSFSLRVDGDAPEALVAQIESALADVKAEVER